jgi:hypothetical protein
MTMTVKQLDQMVDACDTDIRRLNAELEKRLVDIDTIRVRLHDARRNREAWLYHPDRPDDEGRLAARRDKGCF